MQKRFTDLMVQNLTLNKLQDADTIMDMQCRGLGLRITPEGRKRWLMVTRFPGSTSPARRTLGEFPSMGLADARAKADLWRTWIGQGKDPKIEEERQRAQELRRQSATFGAVAEAFFADIKRRGLRRTHETEGQVRREFNHLWKRPITDIEWFDVKAIIDAAIKRGSPWQGHHIFSYAQRVFGWAREQGTFGITSTPTDGRRPSKVIGAKTPRERVLTDEELRAVWNVSSKFDYPLGPFLRLLILTGQRRGEVANMRWREIDKCLWTVPVERMAEPPGRLTSAINSLSP